MPRKPGPVSPEGSGKGSLSLGQSSQGAHAIANKRAGAGAAAKAAQAKGESAAKSFQLYQGRSVRVGTFDNIALAKSRALGLIARFGNTNRPDFRVVDPVTKKTILRIK